jgi:hypothetical protein
MSANLLKKWKLLQAIVADRSVDVAAKVVAAKLLDHYNTKTGRCDPSYQTIATGIGYSRRHVMRAVACLTSAGWIETKKRGSAGRLASNEFIFAWDREVDAAPAPIAREPYAPDIVDDDVDVSIYTNRVVNW